MLPPSSVAVGGQGNILGNVEGEVGGEGGVEQGVERLARDRLVGPVPRELLTQQGR